MDKRIAKIIEDYKLQAKKSVHFTPAIGKDPEYLGSKVGGTPFLLSESKIPFVGGEYLKLAVQINFEEMDHIDPYPESGILQFWIGDMNRSNYEYFKVIYHDKDEISKGMSQEEVEEVYTNPDDTSGLYPMYGSFALEANPAKDEYMPNYIFNGLSDLYLDDEEVFNHFHKQLKGCKIGGYSFTYKCLVCEIDFDQTESELLLQIDSMECGESSIIWGDLGIGHLSIEREDLENLEFGNVDFYWDSLTIDADFFEEDFKED